VTGRQKRSSKPEDVARTLKLDEAAPLRDQVGQAVRSRYRPVLIVISGAAIGTKVTVQGNVLVGRDPAAGLCVGDAGVSWHHAMIEDRGGTWAAVDLGSTNGTTVNGKAAPESELTHGDKVVFGSTVVRFEVQDAADQAYDEIVSRLINIDDLSGLYLRRRFDAELKTLIQAAGASGGRVGLLMMDLDGVKGINDTHGHAFGAHVIGASGRVIGTVIGQRGIACRFGGDEYLAALPRADRDATEAVGQEILEAIAAHRFEHEGIVLHPGISIGVAAFPEDAQDASTLFQRADEALYRAKAGGKNRVMR